MIKNGYSSKLPEGKEEFKSRLETALNNVNRLLGLSEDEVIKYFKLGPKKIIKDYYETLLEPPMVKIFIKEEQ